MAEIKPLGIESSKISGPKNRGFLDGLVQGIFGTPTDEMGVREGAQVEQAREKDRKDAAAMAESAWKNPGEAHMNGPTVGSGDLLQTVGKLFKLFAGGGAGG